VYIFGRVQLEVGTYWLDRPWLGGFVLSPEEVQAQQDRIEALAAELNRKEAEVAEQAATIAELTATTAELADTNAELTAALEASHAKIAEMERRLD
jgi:septal ring factor EnvC (AmiA/AmiB activator)